MVARLTSDPEARRAQIHVDRATISFVRLLEDLGLYDQERHALAILAAGTEPMSRPEREAFSIFERRIVDKTGEMLWRLDHALALAPEERAAAAELVDVTLHRQKEKVARLHAAHPESPALRRAIRTLDRGLILTPWAEENLETSIREDRKKLTSQEGRRLDYVARRKRAVRRQIAMAGRLGRVLKRFDEEAAKFDHAKLMVCFDCEEIVFPPQENNAWTREHQCRFCHATGLNHLDTAMRTGLVRPDGEGFWAICHRPVPGWVAERAAWPLEAALKPAGDREEVDAG